MTDLAKEKLNELEADVRSRLTATRTGNLLVKGEVALSLIAAARELGLLKSALVFLCEKNACVEVNESNETSSSCCTEALPMMEMAKSLGWEP